MLKKKQSNTEGLKRMTEVAHGTTFKRKQNYSLHIPVSKCRCAPFQRKAGSTGGGALAAPHSALGPGTVTDFFGSFCFP